MAGHTILVKRLAILRMTRLRLRVAQAGGHNEYESYPERRTCAATLHRLAMDSPWRHIASLLFSEDMQHISISADMPNQFHML